MNRSVFFAMLPIVLVGCGEEPVYLSSGTYVVQDQEHSPVPADVLDLVFDVDVDELTLTLSAEGGETTFQLSEEQERDWPTACPTMFNAVALQSFALDQDIELGGEILHNPRLFAEGCQGDQGAFSTVANLASSDWENEALLPSFVSLTLELIDE